MKALFVVNDRSGARRNYDVRALIRQHWSGEGCNIEGCSTREDLDRLIASAINDGIEVIFAVGGDGTVHEVAKRVIGKPLTLGIVPTGSGNGFARHLGLPTMPADLVRAIPSLRTETIDTAEVNGRPFIGVMGVGFDAFIADRFASSTVRGFRTYVTEGLLGYASYRPQDYELTIDGSTEHVRAFVIAVANSAQYGNNARIAPRASVQDGLLHVVVIRDAPPLRLPMMMARLFGGSFDRAHGITTQPAREVVIRRGSAGPAHLDGEPFDMPEELRVVIRPRSLRVLAGSAAHI